jgi:hypothetical protein
VPVAGSSALAHDFYDLFCILQVIRCAINHDWCIAAMAGTVDPTTTTTIDRNV